jgi:hypothetical protein
MGPVTEKPKRVFVTCPECKQRTSNLQGHVEKKHSGRKASKEFKAALAAQKEKEQEAADERIAELKVEVRAPEVERVEVPAEQVKVGELKSRDEAKVKPEKPKAERRTKQPATLANVEREVEAVETMASDPKLFAAINTKIVWLANAIRELKREGTIPEGERAPRQPKVEASVQTVKETLHNVQADNSTDEGSIHWEGVQSRLNRAYTMILELRASGNPEDFGYEVK